MTAKDLTISQEQGAPNAESWKKELVNAYSSIADLLQDNFITLHEAQKLEKLGEKFKIRITPYYAQLMENSPLCPIRKQAIPSLEEEDPQLPEWASSVSMEIYGRPTPWDFDAIGDVKRLASPRLTHRYKNRAILHFSSMCAVYCRFCFRKTHLNDQERTLYEGSLDPAFEYLKKTPEIRELILTGGDPLSVPDSVLRQVFERISQIPFIKTVRIHSRMAVTLPIRFTSALLEILNLQWPFQICLVSHFNHPKELSPLATTALKNLKKTGITLLNQSVLLNSVNSTSECLAALFQELYEHGVIPFYLHHPDWTPGTFSFRTSLEQGKKLFSQVKGLISGPALPHYVLDIPQGYGKTTILDQNFRKIRNLAPSDSPIQGALYEVLSPHTRAGDTSPYLYLDLFPA